MRVVLGAFERPGILHFVTSEGTSELQLRDCAQLVRLGAATLDRAYLARWAARRGVSELLDDLEP